MNPPKGYVEISPGHYAHPSRVGGLLPTVTKPDPIPALDQGKKAHDKRSQSVALRIRIIRVGARTMDSDENLPFAYKGLKDAIAESLGVDDNDKRIEWRYEQIIGKPHGTIVLFSM